MISNVAMANLILPIAAELATSYCENPLVFMIPVTMACSFAFMMPAATPPNAIVFSFNMIKVWAKEKIKKKKKKKKKTLLG